jgi:hypothetical protein
MKKQKSKELTYYVLCNKASEYLALTSMGSVFYTSEVDEACQYGSLENVSSDAKRTRGSSVVEVTVTYRIKPVEHQKSPTKKRAKKGVKSP